MSLNEKEISLMRIAGKMASDALKFIETQIKPGISTLELDQLAHDFIIKNGGIPAFLNHEGFPGSICASVNEVVVHGIPSKDVILKEGDIISIDLGVKYKGYYSDAARTFPVGEISKEKQKLIDVTVQSFFEGIKKLKVGVHLGDVSSAIQDYAEKNGMSVVRELVGHGIGKELHMEPQVPNYGTPGKGVILESNICLAIEPMLNLGKKNVLISEDGWTVFTKDGSPSAHYENTVLLTENGVEILTLWVIKQEIL